VAAIDCGTNSIRLLVAEVDPDAGGAAVDVVRRMEIVRLGGGVDRTGRLAPDAIERTRVALADYARQIAGLGVVRTRMVATSATRDAANAGDFRAMVLATLGQPPEVITGTEEAALSFAGAIDGLPADIVPPYLVVDIGGGSTEFVLGGVAPENPGGVAPEHAVSVDIGCVRLTERHLVDDPPTVAQIAAAEADIVAAVDRALAAVPARGIDTIIGLAGSVTTVAALALGLDAYRPEAIHHARVSYQQVARIAANLLGLTRAERLALPVMHPGRADVIGAGALILQVLMREVGAATVVASEHDILDGIVSTLH
jgi:exopolyphosphatase / guanosine-5'-triphosphate,3'-diphosphate pyrophosphatase